MWLTEGDLTVSNVTDDADLIKWMMSRMVKGIKTKNQNSYKDQNQKS